MATLTDLVLSDLEVRAFYRLLHEYITPEDYQEQAANQLEENERHSRYYDALVFLAADTARLDGLTTFWRRGQAAAAWEAFEASEGYHSSLDVDEYFQPDADWQETWELAYQRELEAMYAARGEQ